MKRIVFAATLILCVLAARFFSPVGAVGGNSAGGDWFFVVVETHVHQKGVEVTGEHPEERRWYVSNVAALPDGIPDYSEKKKAIEYFDANVVNPAEKRGLVVEYYDQDLDINGGSVITIYTRAEAEEMRKKDVEDRKEQGGNIYSFNLTLGSAKGEETSQPRLVYRNKEQPSYEGSMKQ